MTQPIEERSVRTVRSGFINIHTALDYVSLLYEAEYKDSEGVQVILEQDEVGVWSVVMFGTRSVASR